MVYYAYILQLKDGSYYHGYSDNLQKRLADHNRGIVISAKSLRPLKLVFYSAFLAKSKALDFERYLKSSSGFAFRNKHFV